MRRLHRERRPEGRTTGGTLTILCPPSCLPDDVMKQGALVTKLLEARPADNTTKKEKGGGGSSEAQASTHPA